jgi:hypothetical protein
MGRRGVQRLPGVGRTPFSPRKIYDLSPTAITEAPARFEIPYS